MKKKVRPSELKSKFIARLFEQEDFTGLDSLLLRSAEQVLQQALEEELSDHLGRGWYERSMAVKFYFSYRLFKGKVRIVGTVFSKSCCPGAYGNHY